PANRRESKGSVDHSATKTNDQKQRAPIKGASPLRLLHKQKPQPVAAVRGASADGSIALLGDGDGHAVHVVGHGDLAGQTGIVLEGISTGHQLVFVFVALAGFFEPATFDVHVTGGAGTHAAAHCLDVAVTVVTQRFHQGFAAFCIQGGNVSGQIGDLNIGHGPYSYAS